MFIICKNISDGENNFTQNKYNRVAKKWVLKISAFFNKISAKIEIMGSSTVQLHGVDLIDIQIQNWL